jgi:hypothetical protein
MAYTLAQLRTLVLQRADMENTTFINNTATTSELSQYIRDSAAALHDRLISLSGGSFLWGIDSIATTAGDSTYALSTEFYRLLRVELLIDGYGYPLDRWDHPPAISADDGGAWDDGLRDPFHASA